MASLPEVSERGKGRHQGGSGERTRRQFSLGAEALERLAVVQKRTGAASRSEVIRNALRVYDFLSEEDAKGHRVLIEQDDKSFIQLKIL